jgi:hypothetical protein
MSSASGATVTPRLVVPANGRSAVVAASSADAMQQALAAADARAAGSSLCSPALLPHATVTAAASAAGTGGAGAAAQLRIDIAADSRGAGESMSAPIVRVLGDGRSPGTTRPRAAGFGFDVHVAESEATSTASAGASAVGVVVHAIDPGAPPVVLVADLARDVALAAAVARRSEVSASVARSLVEVVHADPGR